MQRSKLTLNFGGLNISIISETERNLTRRKFLHPGFILDDRSSRSDLTIEEIYSKSAEGCLNGAPLIFKNRYWSFYQKNGYKIFALKSSGRNHRIIGTFDSNITRGKIYLSVGKESRWFGSRLGHIIVLNLFSLNKRILFHASGVIDENKGYLFLGKSGAGKTTMAGLWSDKGYKVIHDDNMVVYKEGRDFIMSAGGPRTPLFKSCSPFMRSRLKKIFFLGHGEKNRLRKKDCSEAFSTMVRGISLPAWDKKAFRNVISVCSDLATAVACYDLAFLPDHDCIDLIRKID